MNHLNLTHFEVSGDVLPQIPDGGIIATVGSHVILGDTLLLTTDKHNPEVKLFSVV